jgi:hypothetical protein
MSDSNSDRSQVLRAAAARKHDDAVQRAERAIRQLVKRLVRSPSKPSPSTPHARPPSSTATLSSSDESRTSASSTGARPSRPRQSTPTPQARSSARSPCRSPR